VTLSIEHEGLILGGSDEDLLVRGLANCLDMAGIATAGGPPPAPAGADEFRTALLGQRKRWVCAVHVHEYWRGTDPFRIRLVSGTVLDDRGVAEVAGILETFEHLVWGMYPLPGDVYADAGETSVAHLEPNVLDLAMEGVFALPADWQRRLEAALMAKQDLLQLRELHYEL
jgi:hypothetical protein